MAGTIVTVPRYLAAVRVMHAAGVPEMARALRVSPSVVRRWLRGTLVPGWRRVKATTKASNKRTAATSARGQRPRRTQGNARSATA